MSQNQPRVMSNLWRKCRSHWLQTCSQAPRGASEFRGQLRECRTLSKTCTWSLFVLQGQKILDLMAAPRAPACTESPFISFLGISRSSDQSPSDVVVVAMDTKCYSMRQCAREGGALRPLDGRRRPENRRHLMRLEPREHNVMDAEQHPAEEADVCCILFFFFFFPELCQGGLAPSTHNPV